MLPAKNVWKKILQAYIRNMSSEIRISKRAKKVVADDGSSLSWEGVLLIPPVQEGEDSAREFLRLADDMGLADAIKKLKGQFYSVYEDSRGDRFAFVDNGGYFHAFYSDKLVSSDFADFLKSDDYGISDIDPAHMTSLLREGQVYFGKTPLADVEGLKSEDIIVSRHNSTGLESLKKGLGKIFIFDDDTRPLDEIIGESLESFRGRKIAVDLTGGLDSRFTLSFLIERDIPFVAFAHAVPGHPDVEIPKKLAEICGFEFRPLFFDSKELPDYADEMLADMNYLHNTIFYYSNYRMNRLLSSEGFDLRIKSTFGGWLRDFWMLSDWPFCRRKNPNLERLYKTRMKTKAYPNLLANTPLEEFDKNYDAKNIELLNENFSRSPAYLANEAAMFELRGKAMGGIILTSDNRQIPSYAILGDFDVLHSSANLGYSNKRMHRFFRRQVSSISKELGRIRTDRGQSMNSHNAAILFDRGVLVFDLMGRIYRKIRYYATGKSVKEPLEKSEFKDAIRMLPQFPPALKLLQENKFINPTLDEADITTGKIGNIIAAAEIVKLLG